MMNGEMTYQEARLAADNEFDQTGLYYKIRSYLPQRQLSELEARGEDIYKLKIWYILLD